MFLNWCVVVTLLHLINLCVTRACVCVYSSFVREEEKAVINWICKINAVPWRSLFPNQKFTVAAFGRCDKCENERNRLCDIRHCHSRIFCLSSLRIVVTVSPIYSSNSLSTQFCWNKSHICKTHAHLWYADVGANRSVWFSQFKWNSFSCCNVCKENELAQFPKLNVEISWLPLCSTAFATNSFD